MTEGTPHRYGHTATTEHATTRTSQHPVVDDIFVLPQPGTTKSELAKSKHVVYGAMNW